MRDRSVSKSQLAYDHMRSAIVDHVWNPGFRIVLQPVADELDMSVVPVREAVRQLEAEGFVTFERNVGARVTQRDDSEYLALMQMVAINEGAATALAARHLSEDDLTEARMINDTMELSLGEFDAKRFTELNRQFHTILFRRCPNAELRDFVDNAWERLDAVRTSTFRVIPGRSTLSVAEHEQLLDLIETKAPLDVIEKAARGHRSATIAAYLDRQGKGDRSYVAI